MVVAMKCLEKKVGLYMQARVACRGRLVAWVVYGDVSWFVKR